VYIVVIPGRGGWGPIGGSNEKFSMLTNARHNPLHKSVNFYPGRDHNYEADLNFIP